jgi:hypothetical protein
LPAARQFCALRSGEPATDYRKLYPGADVHSPGDEAMK